MTLTAAPFFVVVTCPPEKDDPANVLVSYVIVSIVSSLLVKLFIVTVSFGFADTSNVAKLLPSV